MDVTDQLFNRLVDDLFIGIGEVGMVGGRQRGEASSTLCLLLVAVEMLAGDILSYIGEGRAILPYSPICEVVEWRKHGGVG